MSATPRISVAAPRRFTIGAMVVIHTYGLCLAVPVLAAILLMTLQQNMTLSVMLPFVAILGTAWFLPFGLGNPHVRRLVNELGTGAGEQKNGFVVQVSMNPRIRSGVLAAFEDADDIGWLRVTDTEVIFDGDSVRFAIPREHVKQVRLQNIGLRGLFVYGPTIQVRVTGLPTVQSIEVAERCSWTLPTSRRVTRKLYQTLSWQTGS